MGSEGERLDIVIYGATGFTGKVVVSSIVSLAKEKSVSWGIAGRNKSKLEEVLKEVSNKSGENLAAIPIILADAKDETSLQQMAARARVVVNCVGPYRFFGEAIVKACVFSGSHHVDVSGEPYYLEKMQLEFHKAAEEKGVYVVGACGVDSIPADLGTLFLMKEHKGDLNSVEIYLEFQHTVPIKGAQLHVTTWESAIHGVHNYRDLRPLREKLYPTRLPKFTPKLKPRSVHRKEGVDGWCVPFPGSDRSVVLRSQRYFYEHDKIRPAQVGVYVSVSFFTLFMLGLMGAFIALLTKFEWGRDLLLKYPQFFTAGIISDEGPSEETLENTNLSLTVYGDGWSERLAEPIDQHNSPPNKKVVVRVSGKNPGYGLTSVMVLLSAITILKESDKMPGRGGVYTTGAAFSKTSLIEELNKRGLKFEVLSVTENSERQTHSNL